MSACLNAANEELVAGFLAGRACFTDIPRHLAAVMERHDNRPARNLEDLLEVDSWARGAARALTGGAPAGA
jgi:1-deoxy-D-xylulose-5-phosphate reductoisomerase